MSNEIKVAKRKTPDFSNTKNFTEYGYPVHLSVSTMPYDGIRL